MTDKKQLQLMNIRNSIAQKAAAYTPEWHYSEENPCAASVIALIFSEFINENYCKLEQTAYKYRTELANMLQLSVMPAQPAKGFVIMKPSDGSVQGAQVAAGTKLLAEGSEGIIFETSACAYITAAKLVNVLCVNGKKGKIVPLLGNFAKADFTFSKSKPAEVIESLPPFTLFDENAQGIEEYGLAIFHKTLFDTHAQGCVSLCFTDSSGCDVSHILADKSRFTIMYYSENGFTEFDKAVAENNSLQLYKSGEYKKIKAGSNEYSAIYIRPEFIQSNKLTLRLTGIASKCEPLPAQVIHTGTEQLKADCFMPFGETASLYDECYICHSCVFSKSGADIHLSFSLSFKEKYLDLTQLSADNNLKPIKRRPKEVQFDVVTTSPHRIAVEYFNGLGWQVLDTSISTASLFNGDYVGEVSLRFICPDDWKALVIGAAETRCLRLRLLQADNCFLRPCMHVMPVIKNLLISYAYSHVQNKPQLALLASGNSVYDITDCVIRGENFSAIKPLEIYGNELYLGFDKPFGGGPVNILFNIKETIHKEGSGLVFEYSTSKGFSQMSVSDGTKGLTQSGIITFVPHSDFAKQKVCQNEAYYIKIKDEKGVYDSPSGQKPVINAITVNAVMVENTETLDAEPYYVERGQRAFEFKINAKNILDLEVYVNEKSLHSSVAMAQMLAQMPRQIKAEFTASGEISEFYVLWSEVETFAASNSADRHYIVDRLNNSIKFSDGLKGMKLPVTDDVAFTVRARCCDGVKGNLPSNTINDSFSRLLFIDSITNPAPTFAGSNIETAEQAQQRASYLINSRGRLVSQTDYVREVMAFSGAISKVRCVANITKSGKPSMGLLNIVILMQDYKKGSQSFHIIEEKLKEHLCNKSECTVSRIVVAEPVFVEISVDVWAEIDINAPVFDIQNAIKNEIDEFLSPLASYKHGGREIGELPASKDIMAFLCDIDKRAVISNFSVSAMYEDESGAHYCDPEQLKHNKFVVCVSGRHNVHLKGDLYVK